MTRVVAVAGGTGGLGRTIVEALRDIQTGQNLQTIVLSRKAAGTQDSPENPDLGVTIVEVDYKDEQSLEDTLVKNQVHTIICAFGMPLGEDDGPANSQIALVNAAQKSTITRRFILNEWSSPYHEDAAKILKPMRDRHTAFNLIKTSDLEYVLFNVGSFMDCFGAPKVKSNLPPFSMVVDMENNTAAIPGDGAISNVFSYTVDVAKYVAKYVSMPDGSWPNGPVAIAGDKKNWNEIIKIAEEVKGSKFDVKYESQEQLEKKELVELPIWEKAYPFFPKEAVYETIATYKQVFLSGAVDFEISGAINSNFKDIEDHSIEMMMREGWGKK